MKALAAIFCCIGLILTWLFFAVVEIIALPADVWRKLNRGSK